MVVVADLGAEFADCSADVGSVGCGMVKALGNILPKAFYVFE
jgi:hypothetical protein